MTLGKFIEDVERRVEENTRLFEQVSRISPNTARERKLFGPLYHGTPRSKDDILKTGFNPKFSVPIGLGVRKVSGPMGFGMMKSGMPVGTQNGYALTDYYGGVTAPVHHLGFGIYFTTVKAIAKNYGGGSMKGVLEFWVDAPDMLEINFGAPRTMMNWWMLHGYDMTPEATKEGDFRAWVKSTGNLTRNLRKFGAVHFLGKSARGRLLDGDQVCVYDPRRLVIVDKALAGEMEVGSKVTHTGATPRLAERNDLYVDDLRSTDFGSWGKLGAGGGWRGIFWAQRNGEDIPRSEASPSHLIPPANMVGEIVSIRPGPSGNWYDVKWSKGGVQHNYRESELAPVKK